MDRPVGAKHVVVGQQVREAKPVDLLGEGHHVSGAPSELVLGEDDAKGGAHEAILAPGHHRGGER